MPSSKTEAYSHLRHDLDHKFIELIPGDRTQPFADTSGFHSNDKIKLLVKHNPKRPGTKAHEAFSVYRDGMTIHHYVRAHSKVDFLAAFEERPGRAGPMSATRRQLLPGVDPHSYWAKLVHQIIGVHVSDLGGLDAISEAEKSILHCASVSTIECERLERRLAGYPLDHVAPRDLDLYVKLANSLRHLLDLTGLERRGTLSPLSTSTSGPIVPAT